MSIEKRSIYKCELCGKVVEILEAGGNPETICCGQPLTLLVAGVTDASKEKHVPVVERSATSLTIKVGSVAHPMTPEHHIVLIEVLTAEKVCRREFGASDTVAEATFPIPAEVKVTVREYCNLHGLWQVEA